MHMVRLFVRGNLRAAHRSPCAASRRALKTSLAQRNTDDADKHHYKRKHIPLIKRESQRQPRGWRVLCVGNRHCHMAPPVAKAAQAIATTCWNCTAETSINATPRNEVPQPTR
jgi:hypothetical protein